MKERETKKLKKERERERERERANRKKNNVGEELKRKDWLSDFLTSL